MRFATVSAEVRLIDMSDVEHDFLDINCGLCGRPLSARMADLGDARFVECETCAGKPPFNTRQVFVAFDQRSEPTRSD